jgi:hypothetical protein
MNHYPAGLFAVVGRAPGVEYQPRAHGLEYVLKYLDEYAEHPKAASDLVEFVNKKNYAEVFWVLRGTKRQCLDHAAAERVTLELHAYCHTVDPATSSKPILPVHLYTRHQLKPEAVLHAREELASIMATGESVNTKGA